MVVAQRIRAVTARAQCRFAPTSRVVPARDRLLQGETMIPTITAFESSPDRGRGMARDMRVRWALEEVGQPYDVRLVSFAQMKEPAHLALQPFGQIPTYQEGDVTLFETGAIVLHIAERHAGLLPDNAGGRASAISWMFAALNTVEQPLVEREVTMRGERDQPWYEQRRPLVEARARRPLGELSRRLGEAEWLDGAFTAGDLMMAAVLFRARGLVEEFPNLSAYVARAEVRPAFRRAFAAQLEVFTGGQASA
jgi:glutathione S-transferase